jgi:DNA-binding LytR/AlgR family response regulator
MRVLIADDEPLACRRLEILLSRRAWIEVVGSARDGRSALDAIETLAPDTVLLDIQMPGLDGLQLAELIARRSAAIAVVFVTAYDAFAVRAFEASAADYLLKPVEPERLDQALGRARQSLAARDAQARADELEALVHTLRGDDRAIWVKDRGGRVRIDPARLDLLEAEGDYVRLHVGAQSWLHRATLSGLLETLDDRLFIRVHRSAAVNLRRIERLSSDANSAKRLRLEGGREVRVGRAFEKSVAEALARS